ncbi:hypothetical protein EKN07_11995 [Actinobaculum sp. 352]|nr:hypothetical protein EKN07_11995 [Actinobaculum sp. 352]
MTESGGSVPGLFIGVDGGVACAAIDAGVLWICSGGLLAGGAAMTVINVGAMDLLRVIRTPP